MAGTPLLVLYDEDCGLCTSIATWLADRDGIGVAAIGSPTGDHYLRDLPRPARYEAMHVIDAAGRRRSGSDGLAPIVRMLPGVRWAAVLAEAFPWAGAAGYELVSRHRHSLSRLLRFETCGVRER